MTVQVSTGQSCEVELGSGWRHRTGRDAVVVSIDRMEEDDLIGLLIDCNLPLFVSASCLLSPDNCLGGLLAGWERA
jgi:hypothetical protein